MYSIIYECLFYILLLFWSCAPPSFFTNSLSLSLSLLSPISLFHYLSTSLYRTITLSLFTSSPLSLSLYMNYLYYLLPLPITFSPSHSLPFSLSPSPSYIYIYAIYTYNQLRFEHYLCLLIKIPNCRGSVKLFTIYFYYYVHLELRLSSSLSLSLTTPPDTHPTTPLILSPTLSLILSSPPSPPLCRSTLPQHLPNHRIT